MDYMATMAISSHGMSLERLRVDVTALNIANMHQVAEPGQAPYRAKAVLVQQRGDVFASHLDRAGGVSPPAVSVVERNVPPLMARDPGHPYADADGFVRRPNVDPVTESINLVTAVRAYEANVRAFNAGRSLALKALDIGGA